MKQGEKITMFRPISIFLCKEKNGGKKNLAKMHKAYVGFTSLWKKK